MIIPWSDQKHSLLKKQNKSQSMSVEIGIDCWYPKYELKDHSMMCPSCSCPLQSLIFKERSVNALTITDAWSAPDKPHLQCNNLTKSSLMFWLSSTKRKTRNICSLFEQSAVSSVMIEQNLFRLISPTIFSAITWSQDMINSLCFFFKYKKHFLDNFLNVLQGQYHLPEPSNSRVLQNYPNLLSNKYQPWDGIENHHGVLPTANQDGHKA